MLPRCGTWSLRTSSRLGGASSPSRSRRPALGRPFVDVIHASRHANMKELRPRGGHIRVMFAFDPRRTAILLIGGDKTGKWEAWYEEMIPIADGLFDEHLVAIEREGARE